MIRFPRNKYRAKPVEIDGFRFASKAEARRYQELLLLEKARKITKVTLQPAYIITINDHKICKVIGDFHYTENGKIVVEDVKGMDTPLSRLKRKLVKACYPHLDWRVVR